MNKVLVTGGAGYIGSHICVELLEQGYEVIVLDNLSNSTVITLDKVQEITGKELWFEQGDVRDTHKLTKLLYFHGIDSVIHLAGDKAVGESVRRPVKYYDNNVGGAISLFNAMRSAGVYNIVFSSSATVYGDPTYNPIHENAPVQVTNPYGRTKLMIEDMLRDICAADEDMDVSILRYFNPAGAHPSGEIGEHPHGVPNNLMPYIQQVASGLASELSVFGNDYYTPDGTGVRDYIHVVDLAKGHINALQALDNEPGLITHNLGTGMGYSVLEIIKAFEDNTGKPIPYKIVPRRAGDIAKCYADVGKAKVQLGWEAHLNINDMCRDAWNWCEKYPNGHPDA